MAPAQPNSTYNFHNVGWLRQFPSKLIQDHTCHDLTCVASCCFIQVDHFLLFFFHFGLWQCTPLQVEPTRVASQFPNRLGRPATTIDPMRPVLSRVDVFGRCGHTLGVLRESKPLGCFLGLQTQRHGDLCGFCRFGGEWSSEMDGNPPPS